jgi:hypothetical protein
METLLIVALTLATVVAGVVAALLWRASTRIPVDHGWDGINTIEQADCPEQANLEWTVGLLQANEQSAKLNRTAAWFTFAAAVLSAATGLVGVLWPRRVRLLPERTGEIQWQKNASSISSCWGSSYWRLVPRLASC